MAKHPFEDGNDSSDDNIDDVYDHSRETHTEDTDMSDDENFSNDEEEEEKEEEEEEEEESNNGDGEMQIDIWNYLHDEEIIKQIPITTLYKHLVLLSKALKQDDTHQAVMHTIKKAREEEDMDFREALDYAIDKRKFLIKRRIPVKDEENDEEVDQH